MVTLFERLRAQHHQETATMLVPLLVVPSVANRAPRWNLREEWALADKAAAFTVAPLGRAAERVTFWSALAASDPILRGRSAEELHRHADVMNMPCAVGAEPRVLRCAELLPDGRWAGLVDGSAVRLSIVAEGQLLADSTTHYVEMAGGQIFALERRLYPTQDPSAAPGAGRADLRPLGRLRLGKRAEDLLPSVYVLAAQLIGAQLLLALRSGHQDLDTFWGLDVNFSLPPLPLIFGVHFLLPHFLFVRRNACSRLKLEVRMLRGFEQRLYAEIALSVAACASLAARRPPGSSHG